jgi:hypothetical protein
MRMQRGLRPTGLHVWSSVQHEQAHRLWRLCFPQAHVMPAFTALCGKKTAMRRWRRCAAARWTCWWPRMLRREAWTFRV